MSWTRNKFKCMRCRSDGQYASLYYFLGGISIYNMTMTMQLLCTHFGFLVTTLSDDSTCTLMLHSIGCLAIRGMFEQHHPYLLCLLRCHNTVPPCVLLQKHHRSLACLCGASVPVCQWIDCIWVSFSESLGWCI